MEYMKTLKCYGWKAEADKLQDGWASWKVVDAKSSKKIVLSYIWLFLFACSLYAFDGLLLWDQCY
jgi:hypothetical protein